MSKQAAHVFSLLSFLGKRSTGAREESFIHRSSAGGSVGGEKNKQRDARVMYFCLGCEESERDGWLHATKAQTWGAFPVSRSALRVRLDREHRSPWANVFTVTQGPG